MKQSRRVLNLHIQIEKIPCNPLTIAVTVYILGFDVGTAKKLLRKKCFTLSGVLLMLGITAQLPGFFSMIFKNHLSVGNSKQTP